MNQSTCPRRLGCKKRENKSWNSLRTFKRCYLKVLHRASNGIPASKIDAAALASTLNKDLTEIREINLSNDTKRMGEWKFGCITIILPGRQSRRHSGQRVDAVEARRVPLPEMHAYPRARARHVQLEPTQYATNEQYQPIDRTPEGYGDGGVHQHAGQFERYEGFVRSHQQLPEVNRGRSLETRFADPSKSITIGYTRRRQFGV